MTDRCLTYRRLRPARYFRPAFFLALLLAGCSSNLPIVPEESRFSAAGIVLSVDVVNFEPTFLGQERVRSVNVEYGDTVDMELLLIAEDTTHFKIKPDSLHFSKKTKTAAFQITYRPNLPEKVDLDYLRLITYRWLDSLKTIQDTVGRDSLRLAGVGQGYYLDLELLFIPGGIFTMGVDSTYRAADFTITDERYAHEVRLGDFFIGRFEVSNIQYYEFWREDSLGHTPRDTSAMGSWPEVALDNPNFPVIGVSWDNAQAFCRWLSERTGERYTLPTEAQWEYTACGGARREFPWSLLEGEAGDTTGGTAAEPPVMANVRRGGDGYTFTAPIDAFASGASRFGPLNMAGNVWEWCLDWYDPDYYKRPGETWVDPQGPDDPEHQSFKVIRGGSWLDDQDEARCTNRSALAPANQEINVGFRVVRRP